MKNIITEMKRIVVNPFNHIAILFGILGLVGLIVEPTSAAGWAGMIVASISMITIVEVFADFDDWKKIRCFMQRFFCVNP